MGSDAKALRAGAPEEPGHSAPELFMSPGKERRGHAQSSVSPLQRLRERSPQRRLRGKRKKKRKKNSEKPKPNHNKCSYPAPQPWPAGICSKENPRHSCLFFTATGRGNTLRCSCYLQELSVPNGSVLFSQPRLGLQWEERRRRKGQKKEDK